MVCIAVADGTSRGGRRAGVKQRRRRSGGRRGALLEHRKRRRHRVPAGEWRGSSGGGAAAKAREKEGEKIRRTKLLGPKRVLGGPGVSDSYVSRVQTPANLPHFFLWFAGEIAPGPSHRLIQAHVGWLPRSEQRALDKCGRFAGPPLEMP